MAQTKVKGGSRRIREVQRQRRDGSATAPKAVREDRPKEIVAEIGENFFPNMFGGKTFIHGLVETVKNGRDEEARSIRISFKGTDQLVILDDGKGMGPTNQSAFVSVDKSTHCGSAQFGTGAKTLIFSHAKSFTVRTVSREEPGVVCVFTCSVDELNDILRKHGRLVPEYVQKTARTWPHPFSTGTEITYVIRDPKRRAILRGEELAEELAARLPLKFRQIVTVDGEPIPEKVIVGEVYQKTVIHPQLGEVTFEIYRPDQGPNAHSEDDLLLGYGEVGEIPMANFYSNAGKGLRGRIPSVFLLREVCGFISVPYLRNHSVENRTAVNPTVADDPQTVYLVDLLRSIEPEVREALQLESRAKTTSAATVVRDMEQMLRTVYGRVTDVETPKHEEGEEDVDGDGEGGKRKRSPLRLRLERHEYGIGERIDVVLEFDDALAKRHDLKMLEWTSTPGIFSNLKVIGRGATLTAANVGRGTISVDLPGTPHGASANVSVVKKRRLAFTRPTVTVTQGADLVLRLRNVDCLRGRGILFRTSGRNTPKDQEIDPRKGIRMYTDFIEVGAVVEAIDDRDDQHVATCELTVLPPESQVIVIRGEKFVVKDGMNTPSQPPVTIIRCSDVHEMYVNPSNRCAEIAAQHGDRQTFMIMMVATEFARFKLTECGDGTGEYSVADLPRLIRELSLEVAGEIMNGKPVRQG